MYKVRLFISKSSIIIGSFPILEKFKKNSINITTFELLRNYSLQSQKVIFVFHHKMEALYLKHISKLLIYFYDFVGRHHKIIKLLNSWLKSILMIKSSEMISNQSLILFEKQI